METLIPRPAATPVTARASVSDFKGSVRFRETNSSQVAKEYQKFRFIFPDAFLKAFFGGTP